MSTAHASAPRQHEPSMWLRQACLERAAQYKGDFGVTPGTAIAMKLLPPQDDDSSRCDRCRESQPPEAARHGFVQKIAAGDALLMLAFGLCARCAAAENGEAVNPA
ncbi:MAG: hypothetical protein ACTHU1_13545 [Arachnia sp.]